MSGCLRVLIFLALFPFAVWGLVVILVTLAAVLSL